MSAVVPNQAAQEFINEYTRQLLVGWADHCLRHGSLPQENSLLPQHAAMAKDLSAHAIYVAYAQEKGWLSKKDPMTVLAAGYKSAGAYLRR